MQYCFCVTLQYISCIVGCFKVRQRSGGGNENKISAPKMSTLIKTVHPKSTETSVKEQGDGVASFSQKNRVSAAEEVTKIKKTHLVRYVF